MSLPAINCAATPAITIGSYSVSKPIVANVSDSAVGSINFFLNVTCAVCPDEIPANCIACTTDGPVEYVIVLDTPSESVYVNGLGNSTSDEVTGAKLIPVVS